MSAIFGLLFLDGRSVEKAVLQRMSQAVAAQAGERHDSWTEAHVGLGQRMSCYTPEDRFECQPLVDPVHSLTLVSNSRLDNRPELAEELGIAASEARALPDSQFILRAYLRWGADCPRHLIGAFGFAVFDGKEQTLQIARSARGERSIFYYLDARVFAFSSAPKGLFATGFVPRKLNLEMVADSMVSFPRQPGKSFYEAVVSVPAGHSLRVTREGTKLVEFWHLDPERQIRFRRDEDYVEAFNAVWNRSISDNLRSISPVGVMLSSGLDSTAIAAEAASQLASQGKQVYGFTQVPSADFKGAVPQNYYPDESRLVREMAGRYENLHPEFVHTDGSFYLDHMTQFFESAEFPMRSASNWLWFAEILRRCGERGIRVIYTGRSGNLTISWPGFGLMHQLIGTFQWGRAIREARGLAKNGVATSAVHALAGGVLPYLPEPLWIAVNRARHPRNPMLSDALPWLSYSLIRLEFAKEQKLSERSRERGHSFRGRPGGTARAETLRLVDHPADILRASEEAFGGQLREPADDQRVIEFCLAVPEDQCSRDGTNRWLIRRSMAGRLPDEILLGTKRGYQAADWFHRLIQNRSRVLDEISGLEKCRLASHAVDLPRMRRMIQTLPDTADKMPELKQLRATVEIGLSTALFLQWAEA